MIYLKLLKPYRPFAEVGDIVVVFRGGSYDLHINLRTLGKAYIAYDFRSICPPKGVELQQHVFREMDL